MTQRLFYALPLVAILLLASGCNITLGDDSGSPSGGHSSPASATGPETPKGSPSIPNDSVGTPRTTFRGTNGKVQVSCDALDTEFMVIADDGRIRWTAYAGGATKTKYPFVDGIVSSVNFDPPSGVLDAGQSRVVHMSGTFTGSNGNHFYVAVGAPNSSGSGASTIEFFCE